MAKTFFVTRDQIELSYDELLESISETNSISRIIRCSDPNVLFTSILASLLHDLPITLVDGDVSEAEMHNLGIGPESLNMCEDVAVRQLTSLDELFALSGPHRRWTITLFTSGTTGIPKRVTHNLSTLTRLVRVSERHENDVWGLAYNPTHIAGIQVFLQAIMNNNTLVDLFNLPREDILERIEMHSITNISATPTFYRLLLPATKSFNSVRRLTSGGEKFDPIVSSQLQSAFPNAQFRNIYASTEAGSVLESKNDIFTASNDSLVRIIDGKLWLNKSVLGVFGNMNDWYDTGDLVEILGEHPLSFKFVSRGNEMINVGGYKVNPTEVEEALNSYPGILRSKVYGKPNALLGTILLADVVAEYMLDEKDIRKYLSGKVQDFKIPRMLNFVDSIEVTRTGKIKRT